MRFFKMCLKTEHYFKWFWTKHCFFKILWKHNTLFQTQFENEHTCTRNSCIIALQLPSFWFVFGCVNLPGVEIFWPLVGHCRRFCCLSSSVFLFVFLDDAFSPSPHHKSQAGEADQSNLTQGFYAREPQTRFLCAPGWPSRIGKRRFGGLGKFGQVLSSEPQLATMICMLLAAGLGELR